MARFPIGLDFPFTKFLLHFFLSWTSSLSISSYAIFASTLSNDVLLGLPTGLLPSTLNSIHFFTQSSSLFLITFPHHMSIPSQPTTSNDNRLNSNQPSQFFTCCLPTPMTLASGGGGSDVPASGPPASFSVHLASNAVTLAGSVHKFRDANVVRMWVQLKR